MFLAFISTMFDRIERSNYYDMLLRQNTLINATTYYQDYILNKFFLNYKPHHDKYYKCRRRDRTHDNADNHAVG